MNAASTSAIVAKLRSGKYATPDDLAQAIVSALAGVEKNQTTRRGLEQDQIVGKDGGTLLSATDQSAGRQSVDLQYPQFLRRRNAGGAIFTKLQRRADLLTKTVPAMVVGVEGEGADTQLTVALIGEVPAVTQDDITGQNMPADPMGNAYQDYISQSGRRLTLPMTGSPFAGTGTSDTGLKVPAVGDTIHVSLTEETEKMTLTARRGSRSTPKVLNYPGSTGAAVVNGFCCTDTGNEPPGGT